MRRVELRGIAKSFGGVHALKGVDVTIEAGQVLALLGENGAGKSTLIKVLTGAVTPDSGTILLDGVATALTGPLHAQALGIAAVYQEPLVFRHMSVLDNIFAGHEHSDAFGLVRREAMRARIRPWLGALELPETLLDRTMGSLGPGQTQLVLIAQALARDARVIILDEPTSVLSRAETDLLFAIVQRLRADGRAIVHITHRLEEVPRIGDRVTVLTDGRVTGDFAASDVPPDRLLRLMAGRSEAAQAEEAAAARAAGAAVGDDATPLLAVRGLGRAGAYADVDWDVPVGHITGIYGLVGAGRSEVAAAVFGLVPAERGTILLDGRTVRPRSPRDAVALGIGYLPEDRKRQGVFAPRALEANLTSNAVATLSGSAFRLAPRRLALAADAMLRRYAIKAADHRTAIGTLSGGNQQKGLFARWAGRRLRVLILDEPTRGIDIRTKHEIHDFVRGLAADGVAVAVISSDLAEVMALGERVIVMRRGRVVSTLRGDALTAENVLAAAIGAETAAHRPDEAA